MTASASVVPTTGTSSLFSEIAEAAGEREIYANCLWLFYLPCDVPAEQIDAKEFLKWCEDYVLVPDIMTKQVSMRKRSNALRVINLRCKHILLLVGSALCLPFINTHAPY